MGLQIITGDLSVNKKRVIIEKLLHILETNPNATIYYIVPDHLKFDMETFVLNTIEEVKGQEEAAMMSLQVVSFTRLAWFMIRPQSLNHQTISDVGLTMIIRQLLSELKDELIVLRGQINHQGFIDKLLSLFNELIEGNITPEDLSRITTDTHNDVSDISEGTPNLEQQKIVEIQLIYTKFIERIDLLDVSQYSTLEQLEAFIKSEGQLDDHYAIIDHYYYFNAQQMSLLMQLSASFSDVWLTLPITHSLANSQTFQPILDTIRYTYHQVKALAQFNQIKVSPDWDINKPLHTIGTDLLTTAKLFKDIQEIGTSIDDEKTKYLSPPIEVWQADTIQTELRHVSNQIHHLVATEGYRYQDIVVMTREFERYQVIAKPYFDANDIPIFIDNVAKMNQHPFVLLLESLLNLKLYNWKYDDVMGFLKSGLIIPKFLKDTPIEQQEKIKDQEVNYFENIILANGYFGYRLIQPNFTWHFEDESKLVQDGDRTTHYTMKELAERWRQWIISDVSQAFKAWESPMTGQKAGAWVYQLMLDLGVRDEFVKQRDISIDTGEVESSRRDEQVWQVFVDLLDEFNEIYQDQTISYALFVELLIAGLCESSYHIIPATLDQVTLTSVESPQVQPFKIAFYIGMDDKTLPLNRPTYSLLDEASRELLQKDLLPHQYLMKLNEQQYSQELLLAYQLLLNASERIYFSYATSVNNQSMQLSPYIMQIVKQLKLPSYIFTHDLVSELEHLHPSTFGKYSMEQNLLLQLSHYLTQDEGLLNNLHKQVFLVMDDYDGEEKETRQSIEAIVEAVAKFNELPTNIAPEIAIQLFGKDINASVSKIEQYFQDPFSHFLLHGLKIKERKLFELDYARSGDYFHDFLDSFTRLLIDEKLDLRQVDMSNLKQLFNQVKGKLEQDERFNIMFSHAKFNAIKTQMDEQLFRFIKFSQAQQKRTKMTSIQSEAVFGISPSPDQLKGFIYPLNSGGHLSISGKIDRVDTAKTSNNTFIQIVDYKSGKKEFNVVDTYYGLDLQVLTYLSVALSNYSDTKAFGAFYQPLIHSYTAFKEASLPESLEAMEELQLSENTFNGFVSVDEEQLTYIDSSIEVTNNSLIYPVKFKKGGLYNAYSRVFTEEELDILLKYVHMKFKQAANQIQNGVIELKPFKENQYTTSLQPEYRVISGFDSTENYQAYREKTINKKNIIQEMLLELDESGEDEEDDE